MEWQRTTQVLVVGAGPAGSAAAAWAAHAGREVLLLDAAEFPRDKTCGDGLTPRAIAELELLGMGTWLTGRPVNQGVRMIGFGRTHELAWNGPNQPSYGSAAPRTELDDALRQRAIAQGAHFLGGHRVVDVIMSGDRVAGVVCKGPAGTVAIGCERLIVADGVRSQTGRHLGRTWHRDTVYGVAARAYIDSDMHTDPWITSHLELRDEHNTVMAGYGWIFPLGNGGVNVGVGTLATERRPADTNLKRLLDVYVTAQREPWGFSGGVRDVASAMLPMGGSVSGVAGRNWMFVGDAAGCVNPLNGEGIDYGLETGRLAAQLLDLDDLASVWPATLQAHFGEAFSIARRLGALLTIPSFLPTFGPVGMSAAAIMRVALRVMGNLVTEADRDAVARVWRAAGAVSTRFDARPPWA